MSGGKRARGPNSLREMAMDRPTTVVAGHTLHFERAGVAGGRIAAVLDLLQRVLDIVPAQRVNAILMEVLVPLRCSAGAGRPPQSWHREAQPVRGAKETAPACDLSHERVDPVTLLHEMRLTL